MRILTLGLISTIFANFPTITSNSLLHGVAVRDMLKLQRVQNCLARVVTRAGRFAPSTPPPFVTLSAGYPFPLEFSSKYSP